MVGQNRKLKWSLDDLDLTKPIEPLSRLIDEPEKLIDEVFKIAAQYLPKDIVPTSLKDIPTVELKKLCLEQLKKVEHQTLLNILSNEPNDKLDQPNTSSSDLKGDEKSDLSDDQIRLNKEAKDVEIQVELSCIPTIDSEIVHRSGGDEETEKRLKTEPSCSDNPEEKETADSSIEDPNLDSILDQAEMEIRELELRAQAIRELLKKHEEADNAYQTSSENRKESRKRSRAESSLTLEVPSTSSAETNKTMFKISSPKSFHSRKVEKKPTKESKKTSRLTRNPVSMIEDDETGEEMDEDGNKYIKKSKENRGNPNLDYSSNETNIMIQLNAESDDSIDRELKGE